MSSPWLALKRTSTVTLVAIESTASVVGNAATGLADLAAVGAAHAYHYRSETETVLQQDSQRRINRRVHTLAVEDAEFYKDLNKRLNADPELQALYNSALVTYHKPTLVVAAE